MTKSVIVLFQRHKQIFHALTLGVVVGGARALHNGNVAVIYEISYVLFLRVDEGADQVKVCARKVGDGRKAPDASFKKKIQHEGVDRVIEMMTEGNA